MDEQPQPNADDQEQAPIEAQPDDQPAEAVTTTDSEPTETTNETTGEPGQPENSTEEQTDPVTYWSKKGIDVTTPEGLAKATQSYQAAEKRMHESTQKSSELEKQLTSQPFEQVSSDPTAQSALEMAAGVKLELQVERWKNQKQITPQQDEAIGGYLAENTDKAFMLKNGYLTLDDVYAMSGVGNTDPSAIKAQGGKEALEKLANQQRATSVTGNAVSGAAPSALTKSNVDSWWDGLGSEGRRDPDNQAKLDSVLTS